MRYHYQAGSHCEEKRRRRGEAINIVAMISDEQGARIVEEDVAQTCTGVAHKVAMI